MVDVVAVDSPREGYQMLASAPPDGSTYGLIGADMSALNRGIGGSPGVDSIVPIALTSVDPAGIHVRRDATWRNAGDLVASAKAGTTPIKASGSGRQAVWHLSAHRLIAAAGARAGALAWSASGTVARRRRDARRRRHRYCRLLDTGSARDDVREPAAHAGRDE